jgi:hypothetical protein
MATELHNIPNIQFTGCGKYLASCSISGRITVYTGNPLVEVAHYEQQDWMWSVNWLAKSEVEDIDLKTLITHTSISDTFKVNDLSDYLLLCSDGSKFHLFEFTRVSSTLHFTMSKVVTKSIKFNIMMAMRSDYLRISLAKKLEGLPLVVAGIQNSDTIIFAHILRLDGAYSVKLFEVDLKNDACIQGLDAFTSELSTGLSVTVLALCYNRHVYMVRYKLSTLLQLTI